MCLPEEMCCLVSVEVGKPLVMQRYRNDVCCPCYMGEKTETQMHHELLWELPKQSCVGQVSARASPDFWSGLPSPITSTAGKARCGPALSGAAVEMMSGSIWPVSLDCLSNSRAFECDTLSKLKWQGHITEESAQSSELAWLVCENHWDCLIPSGLKDVEWSRFFQAQANVILRTLNLVAASSQIASMCLMCA